MITLGGTGSGVSSFYAGRRNIPNFPKRSEFEGYGFIGEF